MREGPEMKTLILVISLGVVAIAAYVVLPTAEPPRIVNWFKTRIETLWLEKLIQTRSFSYE